MRADSSNYIFGMNKLIGSAEPGAPGETTLLRDDFSKAEGIKYIKRLLGKIPTDLLSGRTSIYSCRFDGDNSCGVAACFIDFEDDFVTWRDFVWDGDDGSECPEDRAEDGDQLSSIKGLSNYRFERKTYEELLTSELALLE